MSSIYHLYIYIYVYIFYISHIYIHTYIYIYIFMNISYIFHDLWVFPMFRHPVLIVELLQSRGAPGRGGWSSMMAWMNCPETWWQVLHAKTLGIQRSLLENPWKYMEVFSWDKERNKFDYMLIFYRKPRLITRWQLGLLVLSIHQKSLRHQPC